jgi:Homing endonuclease associated repeat
MVNYVTKNTTAEEVITIIRKCAEELGHVPSLEELLKITKISKYLVRRHFGPYVKALEACGLERHGCGYHVEMMNLFLDWAGTVRKLGKVPSMLEYELHGKYTTKPLVRHFGGWTHVAMGMMGYAREAQLEDEWKDVLEVAASSLKVAPPPVDGCDLIVCWKHNWPECPLEVLELKNEIADISPR